MPEQRRSGITVGRRQYNEAELLQMQREAEERVREMQSRARRVAEETSPPPQPNNRNWSTTPNFYRQRAMRWPGPFGQNRPMQQNQYSERQTPPQQARPVPPPEPEAHPESEPFKPYTPPHFAAPRRPDPPRRPPPPPPKKDGTVVGDIMSALNLDEDYLLIIGLILILINQRADTTLILALAYLLLPDFLGNNPEE